MAGSLSRRKIATAVAERLLEGDKTVITELAAYLIETKQTRSLHLMVHEIEAALAERGTLIADVASAHELSMQVQKDITTFLRQQTGAKTVHLRESVDATLLGGLRLRTPNATLDTTIKGKLQQLKAAKQ